MGLLGAGLVLVIVLVAFSIPLLIVVAMVRFGVRIFQMLLGIREDGTRTIAYWPGGGCPNAGCGQQNAAGARFCTRCGRPMPSVRGTDAHG